jgi:HPt (histidine-containing phosphotransfer) domain-containing protein
LHKWIGNKNVVNGSVNSDGVANQQKPGDKKTDWADFCELDAKKAIARINNNERLYIDVLKAYANTQSGFANIFNDAPDSGDINLAERTVHSLRGANEIYELANNVEMALRNQYAVESIKNFVVTRERLQNALCEKIRMAFAA